MLSDIYSLTLVGNMNVGKTTLFARLCGSKVKSVNFPGSTVALTLGTLRGGAGGVQLIDTPGTNSIFGTNEDEQISRNLLLHPDDEDFSVQGAVLVADSKNLKRAVALALQYAEFGIPMLFNLNMIDEAESRGITIDASALASILGLDVCTTIATEGRGIDELRSRLTSLRQPKRLIKYPPRIEEYIDLTEKLLASASHQSVRGIAILLLSGDKSVEGLIAQNFGAGMLDQLQALAAQYRSQETIPFRTTLAEIYNKTAEGIVAKIQKVEPPLRGPLVEKLGRWCTRPLTGIPIAFGVGALLLLFVGSFGATFLVNLIHGRIFDTLLLPWLHHRLDLWQNVFLRDLILDPDFGLVPMGLFLALGLVFPVLLCFYFCFGFLEDSGYLPRLSVLLDRTFRKVGLSGKGVLPIVMGFSCVTMAILTTRMLDTRKQKIITTLLLMMGIPCAPMTAVMFVVLPQLPISATLTVVSIIIGQIFAAGFVANRLIPGERTSLLMELPPMRLPQPLKVLKNSFFRSCFFLKEALPIFLGVTVLVFILTRLGGLILIEKALHPVAVGLLGLPSESVQVFLKTIINKESGMATLQHYSFKYSHLQMVVNLMVMLMLMPCINSLVVIIKERGKKSAFVMIGSVMLYAVTLGTILNATCRFLNITF